MITRKELQEIAKYNAEIIAGFYPLINQKFIEQIFLEGALCAYYRCPYSKDDMMKLVEWVDKGLWTMYNSKWYNSTSPKGDNMITTDELLKLWEEQK